MESIFLGLSLFFVILYIITDKSLTKKLDNSLKKKLGIVELMSTLAFIFLIIYSCARYTKNAYIDCLKGHNKYRIEIREEYRDGKFYDSDTLYVKIKK